MTKGKAVPSFRPASPVRANRSRSRSVGSVTWTSEASTGSVGARIAPSRIAAPHGRPSPTTPATATRPIVTTIEPEARRTGSSQSASRRPTRSFSPAVNSETITATSVNRSSKAESRTGSSRISPKPDGPRPNPTAR